MLTAGCIVMLSVVNDAECFCAEFYYVRCSYAECHYVKHRYAQCR
jgi:hypothetical protein